MKFFISKKKEDDKKYSQQHKTEEKSKEKNEEIENSKSSKKKSDFNMPKIVKQGKTTQISLENSKNQLQETQKVISDDANIKAQTTAEKTVDLSFATNIKDDEKLKNLIEAMMAENTDVIKPTIDFEKNRIIYPILAKIGESEENIDSLEKLATSSVGIFDKEISEIMIVCPNHPQDFSISVRLYCPDCSSMDVKKLELIEHKVCGYIAEMDDYGVVSVSDLRTCPNCKRQIRDINKEIRLPGKWTRCNSCKKKFDNPVIKLHCRRFDHDFDITDVESVMIPKFKVKKDAGKNVNIITLTAPLKNLLNSLGFMVEELSNIKGKSGITHHTDIFGHNEKNQTVAIFIKSANEVVDDNEINSTLVNVLDISPTWTILVAVPSVSERAKAMATSYNVSVVTGKSRDMIIPEVEKILVEKISLSKDSQIRKL